jgi:hypothetical protein
MNQVTVWFQTFVVFNRIERCFTLHDFNALLEDGFEPAVILASVVQDCDVAGLDCSLQMTNHVAPAAFKITTSLSI